MVQTTDATVNQLANSFETMSSMDLKQLRSMIDGSIKRAEAREMQEARDQIQAIAQSVGMSLADIMNAKPASKAKGQPKPIKYRDPENARNEWSGCGRQPKWLADKLANGKTLAHFEVKAS